MAEQETVFDYVPKTWKLSGLQGISDRTLEVHFGLYEGYVKNTNLLREQLYTMRESGKVAGSDPAFAELTRRLGFEYNGMRLHELYFDNLCTKPTELLHGGRLHTAIAETFGDFDIWRREFTAVGSMRGVGWAILFQDSWTGELSNHWIGLHERGEVATFNPVLVMDVWEHAFLLDYKPAERPKYIEAFFANVNWQACEERVRNAAPPF